MSKEKKSFSIENVLSEKEKKELDEAKDNAMQRVRKEESKTRKNGEDDNGKVQD
jgi:hypothetical protein